MMPLLKLLVHGGLVTYLRVSLPMPSVAEDLGGGGGEIVEGYLKLSRILAEALGELFEAYALHYLQKTERVTGTSHIGEK
jgi:hypothetical protein